MSLNVKGDMDVLRYGTSQNRYLASSVGDTDAGADGVLELDTYTEAEVQERLGVIPLSRYGSTNYLPAGAAGSFEGSVSSVNFRMRSLLLEDNGDLVMLRNGTNGSTRNIYYSYLSNALTTTNMNTFVSTNKIYNPAYFNNQYTGLYTVNSDSNVVFGMMERKTDKTNFWFLSVTNNTMNDAMHTGIFFPSNTFDHTVRFVMMGISDIFVFTSNFSNNRLKMYMHSIPIQDVVNQVSNPVFTQITGWTSTSFYGDVFSAGTGDDDGMVICNRVTSTNAVDKPYMLYPSSAVSAFGISQVPDFYANQDPVTGQIRAKIVFDSWCSSYTTNVRPHSKFNYLINLGNKTAKLESSNLTTPLIVNDNSGSYSISGWTPTSEQIYSYYVNTYFTYYILPNGTTFIVQTGNTSNEASLVNRLSTTTQTSIYDVLKVQNNYTITGRGTITTAFASAIGSALVGMELLPNNFCRLYSYDDFGYMRNVRSEYIPPANYNYKSISQGNLLGFAPSVDRSYLSFSADERCFISTINSSGTVTTNGGILTESRLSTFLNYGSDAKPIGSTTISTTSSVLNNFKNSQLVGVPNLDSLAPRIALYVPQQSNIPVFAIIQATQTNKEAYVKVVEVSVNTRVGGISNITFSRLVFETGSGIIGAITETPIDFPGHAIGLTIYEGSDFYFIGGMFPYLTSVVGNANGWLFTAKVMKSTPQIATFRNFGRWYPYTVGLDYPSAIPGYGFGILNGTLQSYDAYTRFIFTPYGTTSADYDAWAQKPSPSSFIIVSQDVQEGFILYFTEETPVILSGKSFKLPITTIDLRTIKSNPANSTFYVYVKMDEGLVKYFISEEVISESGTSAYNTFWIGTVTTNNNQIETVDIKKRARLDIFGTSFDPAGSSFPVSQGLPSQPGTINW